MMTTDLPSSSSLPAILTDPALAPFLSPSFSATAYLNTAIPALQTSSSASTSYASLNPPLPLSKVHSSSSDLLSTLDIQLSRLQATLSSLTDEILRATPRLSYEIEVLRSDVTSLADTLTSTKIIQLAQGLADTSFDEPISRPQSKHHTADNDDSTSTLPTATSKPQVLKKLETLAKVRRHLEDVIKVFGDAMDWTLTDTQKQAVSATNTTSGLAPYAPPSRSTSPAMLDGRKLVGSERFEQEIDFMIANDEVAKATEKVEELLRLCEVFKNTMEYNTRIQYVEGLRWKLMEASKEEDDIGDTKGKNGKNGQQDDKGVYTINLPEVSLPGRDGYLGLFNQFKQMRDSIGQSG